MDKLVLGIFNFAIKLKCFRIPIVPQLLIVFIRIIFSCKIGLGAKLGKGVVLGYGGLGVVIHGRAVIGENTSVGTNVTIGGTSGGVEVPTIGKNVIISTGAKVIGNVNIGDNCVIGANAVVLNDIPDNCVAVGVPAKVIKKNISIEDYKG